MTAPVYVDADGELWTLDQVNVEQRKLNRQLEALNDELAWKMKEQARASYQYSALYEATIASSNCGSADRRKAEAVKVCNQTFWGDSKETLGAAKARLDMQVRLIRDASHNIRTMMDNLRDAGASLRAMMRNLDGDRP